VPRPPALALALALAACELKVANETDEPATTGESASTSATTGEPWTLDGCMTRFFWDCGLMMKFECPPPQPIPHPNCDGPTLCEPLRIGVSAGGAAYDHVIPEAVAPCVLQALRDRTPGKLSLEWGVFQEDGPIVAATVWLLGDETVRMSWNVYDYCCGRHTWYISRRVLLQPPSFFDDCLAADVEGLIDCFTAGLSTYEPPPTAGCRRGPSASATTPSRPPANDRQARPRPATTPPGNLCPLRRILH
jgi:hypothetical protein